MESAQANTIITGFKIRAGRFWQSLAIQVVLVAAAVYSIVYVSVIVANSLDSRLTLWQATHDRVRK